MNERVKLQQVGKTEAKHVASVKASEVYKSNNGLLIGLIAMSIIAAGSLFALATSDTTETPVVPVVEPEPAVQDTQDDNHNHADHGSSNVNGDNNTVTIDNRVTEVHHHHHTTERVEVEKPVIVTQYRTVTVEKPVIQYRTVEKEVIRPECDDSMAEHHERVAGWYRMIARSKR